MTEEFELKIKKDPLRIGRIHEREECFGIECIELNAEHDLESGFAGGQLLSSIFQAEVVA